MAENSIDMVRVAEKKADETIKEAAQESAHIVDEAHDESIRAANKAEGEAKESAAKKVAGAHSASQKMLEESLAGLDGEMQALAEKARSRQDEAVKTLLDSLV